ncbi:MAG: MlaD family protein [Bacteroidota bacterium]
MSRQARLGLLMIAGIAAFVLGLFIIANRTFLFSDTFRVQAEFGRVAGLLSGGQVLYQGINVGRVERVQLPARPGGPITVMMEIREDAQHLIREDSRALIQTDGLVGSVIVSITAGSELEPPVAEGGSIAGVDPLDLSEVSDRLFDSVSRFDSVTVTLTSIMQDIQTGEGTLGRFIYDPALYDGLVATAQETRVSLRGITAQADTLVTIAATASANIESIISKVNEGDGTLARFINDPSVYENVEDATARLGSIANDLMLVLERSEDAANWGNLAMFRLAENMEALKHNFLFKGYYEDRGYLELAPFEIRERALSETYESLEERARELYELEQRLEALRQELETRQASDNASADGVSAEAAMPTEETPSSAAPPSAASSNGVPTEPPAEPTSGEGDADGL